MAKRVLLLAVAVSVLSGCGGEGLSQVSAPSNELLTLRTGPYWLHLTGFAISNDPAVGICENPLITGGTIVTTEVVLSKEIGGWVARSAAGTPGDLSVGFSESGSTVAVVYLAGSISGTALDMQYNSRDAASGVRITVTGVNGGSAELNGDSGRGSTTASGVLEGRITFADKDGRVSTCTSIAWDLIPFS